jgi:hypothetical protein
MKTWKKILVSAFAIIGIAGAGTAIVNKAVFGDTISTLDQWFNNGSNAIYPRAGVTEKVLVGSKTSSGSALLQTPSLQITGVSGSTQCLQADTNGNVSGAGAACGSGGGGSGTVTAFSFTNSGGFTGTVTNSTTTPALSLVLQNATTSQSGQLTSTDWNTFNNKQGAITLTTTGTSGAATFSGGTLNIPQYAGTSPAIGGTITSGTAGSVLYVNPTATIAQDNSNFFYDSTNKRLGIGTASPQNTLELMNSGTNAALRVDGQTTGAAFLFNSQTGLGQDRATFGVNGYYNGSAFSFVNTASPTWLAQLRTSEDDFAVLRAPSGGSSAFVNMLQVKNNGGFGQVGIGGVTLNAFDALSMQGSESAGNGLNMTLLNTSTATNSFAIYRMFAGDANHGGQFFGSRAAIPSFGIANGVSFRAAAGQDMGFTAAPAFGSLTTVSMFIQGSTSDVSVGNMSPVSLFNVGSSSQFQINTSGKIVAYGGSAPTDGQLLIGSTSAANFTAATLTAGTGITITNANNAITIAATGGVTPAALTKTDDTNVTLTLGGTPSTALLQASSLTLGWTGTLAVGRGGTGAGTLTVHGVVIGNGTSAVNVTSAGTSGQVLTSNGSTADPTFQTFTPTIIPRSIQTFQFNTATSGRLTANTISISGAGFANTVGIRGAILSANTELGGTTQSWALYDTQGSATVPIFSGNPNIGFSVANNTSSGNGFTTQVGDMYFGLGTPSLSAITGQFVMTDAHIGFIIVCNGTTATVYGTEANGSSETRTSALTTVAANDTLDMRAAVTSGTSVTYYVSKNRGADVTGTITGTIPTSSVTPFMSYGMDTNNTVSSASFTIQTMSYQ